MLTAKEARERSKNSLLKDILKKIEEACDEASLVFNILYDFIDDDAQKSRNIISHTLDQLNELGYSHQLYSRRAESALHKARTTYLISWGEDGSTGVQKC